VHCHKGEGIRLGGELMAKGEQEFLNEEGSRRGVRLMIRFVYGLLLFVVMRGPAIGQESRPVLPFAGTDAVSTLNDNGTTDRLTGTIENISGETLRIRRSGRGNIQVLHMSDVAELSFHRSAAWDSGLNLWQAGEFKKAFAALNQALRQEDRDWAWCELQATIAKLLVRMGDRDAAVDRIEQILQKDDRSRHVCLLPLVWDESLPADERVNASPEDLGNPLPARRLVAASALLHDTAHRPAAAAVLHRIRQQQGLDRLGELAGAQLWRLPMLDKPDSRNPLAQVWSDQVREMPVECRNGPQYVVARILQRQHQYDKATLGFLWTSLMNPIDEALAAKSLVAAIDCLQQAGRPNEAHVMSAELKLRFPKASATREFQSRATSE